MTTHHCATRLIPTGDTPRPGDTRSPTGSSAAPGTSTPSTPTFAATRSSTSPASPFLLAYTDRLQPRDYTLALLLDEHRVLTTSQTTAILFSSPRTCRNRLDALRRIGFIDRFTPHRPGTIAPAHWVAGILAARYAALHHDQRPPSAKVLRERQDTIVASPQLAHLVGVNQFFTDLLAHARAHPSSALLRWWSAARTTAAFGRRVRPDGHGVWSDHATMTGFWLEHDTGTEPLGRLLSKVEAYRRLHRDGGPNFPVLFWLPTAAREANLHKRLAGVSVSGVTVATAARDTVTGSGLGPADPVWRLAGNDRHRLRLAALPSTPGQPGPYHPGPPTPADDPLRLLHP
jgi:hypothetical protein